MTRTHNLRVGIRGGGCLPSKQLPLINSNPLKLSSSKLIVYNLYILDKFLKMETNFRSKLQSLVKKYVQITKTSKCEIFNLVNWSIRFFINYDFGSIEV